MTYSSADILSRISFASFLSISNMILSLWFPRFGCTNTVALCLLILPWCLLAVVNCISQSSSPIPDVSFLNGSCNADKIFPCSFFQKSAIYLL